MDNRYCVDMLLGCQLTRVGRCADLIWWEFQKNNWSVVLHTQCACRLLQNGISLLSRSGIYYEVAEQPSSKSTLFDAQVDEKILELLPITIQRITCSSNNDLKIIANKGVNIDIFTDNPEDIEQWRIFSPGVDAPHLVAFSSYTEYQ